MTYYTLKLSYPQRLARKLNKYAQIKGHVFDS